MHRRLKLVLAGVCVAPVAVLAVAVLAVAVSAASPASAVDGIYTSEQAASGRAAYDKACASCHMQDLRGEGFAPALNESTFKARWDRGVVGDLFKIIKATMPADSPASLTNKEYAEIVAFLLKENGYPAGQQPLGENPADLAKTTFAPAK